LGKKRKGLLELILRLCLHFNANNQSGQEYQKSSQEPIRTSPGLGQVISRNEKENGEVIRINNKVLKIEYKKKF